MEPASFWIGRIVRTGIAVVACLVLASAAAAQPGTVLLSDDRPLIELNGFDDQVGAFDRLEQLTAEASETRPGEALLHVASRPADSRPSTVIVASNGRSTEVSALEPIARSYRQLAVPIHVIKGLA